MPYKDKEKQEYLSINLVGIIKKFNRVSLYNAKYSKSHRFQINKREKDRRDNDPIYKMKIYKKKNKEI